MIRALGIAALSLFWLTAPRTASAQSARMIDDGALSLSAPSMGDAELASIDEESRNASAVYYTSLSLLGASLGLAGGAYAANPFCISFGGSCGGNPQLAAVLGGFAAATFALSVVSLGIAIGLDADAGSRRGGWERDHGALSSTRLRIGGSGDGVSLALEGTF